MCDYSLDFVASRPAKVGDKLVTTKFKNSVTRGFAAGRRANRSSVCSSEQVEYCHSLLPNQKVAERLARFRQINLEQAFVHHDALEFPNGKIILLARLCEGQHATVLQLPASPRATKEAEQQRHGTLVT
jgi:formate-dependent nitrite reductase cytochrome c552 subunit